MIHNWKLRSTVFELSSRQFMGMQGKAAGTKTERMEVSSSNTIGSPTFSSFSFLQKKKIMN